MNKFTPIYWILIFFLSISGCAKPEEADVGLWKGEDCKKISEAAGFFLYTSGELLKTADKERQAGNEKKSEKTYAAALFFSELSENSAKNFEVFCKK
jgi:hypothetical protein